MVYVSLLTAVTAAERGRKPTVSCDAIKLLGWFYSQLKFQNYYLYLPYTHTRIVRKASSFEKFFIITNTPYYSNVVSNAINSLLKMGCAHLTNEILMPIKIWAYGA